MKKIHCYFPREIVEIMVIEIMKQDIEERGKSDMAYFNRYVGTHYRKLYRGILNIVNSDDVIIFTDYYFDIFPDITIEVMFTKPPGSCLDHLRKIYLKYEGEIYVESFDEMEHESIQELEDELSNIFFWTKCHGIFTEDLFLERGEDPNFGIETLRMVSLGDMDRDSFLEIGLEEFIKSSRFSAYYEGGILIDVWRDLIDGVVIDDGIVDRDDYKKIYLDSFLHGDTVYASVEELHLNFYTVFCDLIFHKDLSEMVERIFRIFPKAKFYFYNIDILIDVILGKTGDITENEETRMAHRNLEHCLNPMVDTIV